MGFTHKVRTAIVGLDASRTRYLEKLLGRWLVPVSVRPDPRDALAPVVGARPQAVLLYVEHNRALALQLARRVRSELPEAALVLLADQDEDGMAREGVRLGARAFVVFGVDDSELAALFVRLSEEAEHPQTCLVLGVFGAKGGVGTSLVAMNIAGAMARSFSSPGLLLDLSPCLGELGLFLDIDTPYGLLDLVQGVHRVDDEELQRNLGRHSSGFHLMGQPLQRIPETALDGEMLLQGLRVLRRHFGWIVLDIGGMIDERSMTSALLSDLVVLLSTPDLPSLVGARRRIEVMQQQGRGPHNTALVLNRVGARAEQEIQRATGVLDTELTAWLHDDPRTATLALENAKLLTDIDPNAKLSLELTALAARLSGADAAQHSGDNEPRRKRLFGLI